MKTKNINSIISTILKYTFIAWIVVIFITPEQFKSGAYAFSAVIFAAASFILFKGLYKTPADLKNKKFVAFSAALTALLLIQLSCTQLFAGFDRGNMLIQLLLQPLFIIFLAAASYITVSVCFGYAVSEKDNTPDSEALKKIPFIKLNYLTLPIAAVTAAFVIASYPSYNYSDIIAVWNQVTANSFSEWHTVAFPIFCRIFSFGGKSRYWISVFYGLFWIYICNYAVSVIWRAFKSKKVCAVYAVSAAALFTPMLYCGMMVKDTIFCMCNFFFLIALFDCVRVKNATAGQLITLAAAAISASIFRHAAFVPVILALILFLIYKIVKKTDIKRVVAVILAAACGISFINIVVPRNIVHASQNPAYVKYSVPMYIISAVSYGIDDISAEDAAVMESIMSRERWREAYETNNYWADPMSRSWGTIGGDVNKLNDPNVSKEIIKLNFKWLFKYPVRYIKAAFDISSIIWEIGRPVGGYEWAPLNNGAMDFVSGDGGLRRNVSTSVTRSFSDMVFQNPMLNPIYWRGGFWLYALLFAAAVLIYKKRYKYLIPIASPLLISALLLLSIPAQDPRYILFLLECGLFAIVFAARAGADSEEAEAELPPGIINTSRIPQKIQVIFENLRCKIKIHQKNEIDN